MKASVFHGTRDIRIDEVPDAGLREPSDALVRVTRAAICGSDLWFYRGISKWEAGWRTGHEFMGVVEAVGSEVRSVRRGDMVIAPFAFSDGTCDFCQQGLQTSCRHGGYWGSVNDGGQAEAVRVPHADGTLVAVPDGDHQAILASLLPLTDVLPTGHHAAVSAGVGQGSVTAVVGDGAVGLCAVLAAKRLGAERIIALGHNRTRLDLALRLGATEAHDSTEAGLAERIIESTGGGAPHVLEAVGAQSSLDLALAIARPGGRVGVVGVPNGVENLDIRRMFGANIGVCGGVAPVRGYIPELLADVLAGLIDPSPILDRTVDLAGVPEGYRAMDSREAIKVMVAIS
ncbi:MAG: zinc-binding dehydrogenase [Candidatus Dormibacteria bacterium]